MKTIDNYNGFFVTKDNFRKSKSTLNNLTKRQKTIEADILSKHNNNINHNNQYPENTERILIPSQSVENRKVMILTKIK